MPTALGEGTDGREWEQGVAFLAPVVRQPGRAPSRRHSAGATSVRGVLLTVLGELVLGTGGCAWTSAFIDFFSRLGVEEKAIRQALQRTAADGWIRPERHGRRTCWRLTPAGEQLLTEGAERIYNFTSSQRDWDGSVLLVLARVPESDRAARHLLRTRLGWAGLGSPAPGVWVTTHTERQAEVARVLEAAGVTGGHIFLAEHQGGGELAALVGSAWDLPAVEERYAEFLAEFVSPSTEDPLTRVVELVHSWRRFPSIDPGLPARLLPERWSGTRATRLFAARRARWAPDAIAAWLQLNK